ncbi:MULTISPECIES: hypothetical protein [Pseudomonas syringae group]|uniref:Uncharacterized protein n=2 Tax=Pseudomonas syringae group TaxID=136849 RepID=A0ABX6HCP4_9PSED|nr:hypothetical protein [Pseudomonas asturiensis]QHF03276.1 hypothetical protein N015_13015 [Pseudomonas asturiensis]
MASLEELRQGLAVHMREPGFYVAAVVGVDNHASQKVAARTQCNTPDAIDGQRIWFTCTALHQTDGLK